MFTVLVHAQVKPGMEQDFIRETLLNARESVKEPGVLRFDVLRSEEQSDRFLLIEVYKHEEAPAAHKATSHYQHWRDAVEPMMAAPRASARYEPLLPAESG